MENFSKKKKNYNKKDDVIDEQPMKKLYWQVILRLIGIKFQRISNK